MNVDASRRPVKSRGKQIFQTLAASLVKMGLTPNQISVMSSVFALLAALSFIQIGCGNNLSVYLWGLLVLIGIQGRLICNLIDGLMAVEGGLKTKTGELFNEVPDRVSDSLIFLGAAYSTHDVRIHILGWLASLLAMATAYIRVLGVAMTAPHFFSGPMAKQHRMFVMNLALIAGLLLQALFQSWDLTMMVALGLIFLGAAATCLNRLQKISQYLNK